MHAKLKSTLCGALALATSISAVPVDVLAMPASVPSQAGLRLPDPIDSVYRRYYRRYPYRYGYRYDPSGAIFAGAAMGLMAAGIAAASQPHYYYGYPAYYGYPGWGW
ncbi:hypothetical protein [Methylocystis bryophila]|uniref:Transmembrane protein n=1 Tax=Methylocystis bryophila TaxID=655015 RepID=A0A1W6MSL0_9HYPH|nr:hypothetical protein [Methylocystis bryophila]ARN80479.1 hypothetical protein B1812_04655 [Methylocystis bryophila]BDV40502.1 hypothetical protein DSM21852_37550 [Methylocystis bryophila]